MTLSGPSIPIAMAEATDTRLLAIDELDLHLLAGSEFEAVADAVGRLREATYRQQLSGSGDEHDLDGRDAHYDHLLLVERRSGSRESHGSGVIGRDSEPPLHAPVVRMT